MQTVPSIRQQIDALLDQLSPEQLERALGVPLLTRWSGHRWPLRARRAAMPTSAHARSSAGDESEITVEPLERPRGER